MQRQWRDNMQRQYISWKVFEYCSFCCFLFSCSFHPQPKDLSKLAISPAKMTIRHYHNTFVSQAQKQQSRKRLHFNQSPPNKKETKIIKRIDVPDAGIEPATSWLEVRCATIAPTGKLLTIFVGLQNKNANNVIPFSCQLNYVLPNVRFWRCQSVRIIASSTKKKLEWKYNNDAWLREPPKSDAVSLSIT